MQQAFLPRLVEKSTGQLFTLVRDDVKVTGVLWVAPVGMTTSMQSTTPELFKERFEWYVDPKDRPLPTESAPPLDGETVETGAEVEAVSETSVFRNKGGRPKGARDKQPRKRRVGKII